MESDFGADLYSIDHDDDDDWVQSYADYYECSYDESSYGASYDNHNEQKQQWQQQHQLPPPMESLEELLVSDKILKPQHHKSKRKNKQSVGHDTTTDACDRPRKRKRNKFKSGAEIFLNEILSWNLTDLMKNTRASLRLPRLSLPSLTYSHFSELSDVVQQVSRI
jgi:hypothetical protein